MSKRTIIHVVNTEDLPALVDTLRDNNPVHIYLGRLPKVKGGYDCWIVSTIRIPAGYAFDKLGDWASGECINLDSIIHNTIQMSTEELAGIKICSVGD